MHSATTYFHNGWRWLLYGTVLLNNHARWWPVHHQLHSQWWAQHYLLWLTRNGHSAVDASKCLAINMIVHAFWYDMYHPWQHWYGGNGKKEPHQGNTRIKSPLMVANTATILRHHTYTPIQPSAIAATVIRVACATMPPQEQQEQQEP
jgi:hypothetical protein